MRRRNRQPAGLWAVLAPVALTAAVVTGQPSRSVGTPQDVPAIEYTLARVLGGESWSVREASISPDGRWIAFAEGDETSRLNLWLVSVDGGPAIPLTSGPYIDDSPTWFPSGDRVAFRSNRAPVFAVMTVPLDPASGRPTGVPRQVTLDSVQAGFDVSPDGRWIAYTASTGQGGSLLKVLPSEGGVARTLGEGILAPRWSPDGDSIYYAQPQGRSTAYSLVRVFLDGRRQIAFTWPGPISVLARGSNRHFVLRAVENADAWEIATLSGRAVGRIVMPKGMRLGGISREGDRIVGVRLERSAPLKIQPVEGGVARRVSETPSYDEPLGWSPDGQRVLVETVRDGEVILLYAPVDGAPARPIDLPEARSPDFAPVLSADGNHLLYVVDEAGGEVSTLKVHSLDDHRSWELSRVHTFKRSGALGPTGAGGTAYRDGEAFLYFERRSGSSELHASPPRGPSRLLRNFGATEPLSVAVHGDRIVWVENSGGDASLLQATAAAPEARRLLHLPGMLDMVVWSFDGTRLAVYYYDPARSSGKNWDPVGRELLVLAILPSGGVEETGRYTIPAGHWWAPRWLPDGRRILAVGMDGNVWMIPLERSARPEALTQDEPNGVWQFELSPDGRHIAYPSLIQQASSIWLAHLHEPLISDLRR